MKRIKLSFLSLNILIKIQLYNRSSLFLGFGKKIVLARVARGKLATKHTALNFIFFNWNN